MVDESTRSNDYGSTKGTSTGTIDDTIRVMTKVHIISKEIFLLGRYLRKKAPQFIIMRCISNIPFALRSKVALKVINC